MRARRADRRRTARCVSVARIAVVHRHHHAVASVERPPAPTPVVVPPPCTETELRAEAETLAQARAAVFCLVNRLRVEHGEHPLTLSTPLEDAAEVHGLEMDEQQFFEHTSPDGSTITLRDEQAGYITEADVGYVVGENLAWGTLGKSTPASIVAAWEASPDHLANMLESRYTQTGIAVLPQTPSSEAAGIQGATYVQEFGTIVE